MQQELSLIHKASQVQIPDELIFAKKTQGAAFSLACDASGREDKEIYLDLNIDAGTFSRMRDGKNTLPADRIRDFCEAVGNNIYPRWIAYQVGCGLVMLKSEAERQRDEERERAEKAEAQVILLKSLLIGRAA